MSGCLSGGDPDPTQRSDDTAIPPVAQSPTSTASPTASAVDASPLEGTSWRLIELAGEPVDPSFGVTLEFGDNRLSGYSGCNEFGAPFSAFDSGDFAIGDFFTTDALCREPPHLMNFQERLYDALAKSVRYFLNPPRLALHGANDDTLLLFEPLEDDARSTPTPPAVAFDPTPTTPIAEYGNVEIYVMNVDGSDQHRPAPSLAGEHRPEWMPDGRLTFQSDRSGEGKLYAVKPDGAGLETLPIDLSTITSSVQWSANDSQIYYASNIDGLEQLYVADGNGSNPRRITEIAGGASSPDWSADGSKVVFTNGSHGPAVIYSVNTDGTNLQLLTFDQDETEDAPVWSPDGTQIAFGHFSNDGEGGIFIMDADGRNIRRLTDGGSWIDSLPSWSPDGTRIAFNRGQGIWVINVDGTGLQRLTDSPFSDEGPVWSPDGTQIAFVSNRDGGGPVACSFSGVFDYVWMESLDQLVWMSDQIVVAEVVEQFPSAFGAVEDRSGIEQMYPIYTDYLIEVDTWIRGRPSPSLRLRRPGGVIGDCAQSYDGEPQFEIGNRILLFLITDELNPELPPASIMLVGDQSFWPVDEDGTVENEWFPDYDGASVDNLAEAIREILRQPEPGYPNLVPLEDSPIVEEGGES
ncbi:MAG: META domain-containing protein [Thermomicrobiales bacterium]